MSVAGASDVVVWLATGGVPALADAPGQACAATAASSSAALAETIAVVLIMLELLAFLGLPSQRKPSKDARGGTEVP